MAHPEFWERYTAEEKEEAAITLFNSMRGKLILGQALAHAISKLNEVEPPVMRERSNIEDMECIGLLFEPFFSIYQLELNKQSA